MGSRSTSSDRGYRLRVLMLPWLAHGHISPFLELAKKLTRKDCFVYLCSSPVNLSSIEHQLHEYQKDDQFDFASRIRLVELHLPDHLPDLPPGRHTTKSLPTHLMPTLKHAFDLSRPSFSTNILAALKPDVLIYDFIQPWAPATASEMGIPAVLFLTTAASSSAFFSHFFRGSTSTEPDKEARYFPFPSDAIYLEEHEARKIGTRFGGRSNGLTDEDRFYQCSDASTGFIAIKTFRELESKYIDYLSRALGKEMVPVGPLVQDSQYFRVRPPCEFTSWLDGKEKGSTVFVSFGTEYFMSEEEIEEVGLGLELSGVHFVWVIRFPDRRDVREALPSGFLERVGGRGLVVEGWAPQGRILAHPSVGGFLSHCGWSSVLEGMWFGVPLIALPLQLDQPINARLVVELGVGVEVKRTERGEVRRGEVARRIREVVGAAEKVGDPHRGVNVIRAKVKQMSGKMRGKGDEEIDVFVKKLIDLCHNKA
ncbi:hypothetical protein H6P81_007965 [Aristolochia fimbriata]|uniref:Glycosyltransferase n=1 Tax=Aristolochia fimbriata TaxID=158543 RepID=A0AAV7F2Z2_ARIFI|nr:hypothetical protein H6P81_007965 [Aristolochia fimbriata]